MHTIIISVNKIQERADTIKSLYKSLSKQNKNKLFTIQQDRVDRIKIFHNKKSLKILIVTYQVIILPILCDFTPLETLTGTIDFRLDKTIDRLINLTSKVYSLQGRKEIKGKSLQTTLNQIR